MNTYKIYTADDTTIIAEGLTEAARVCNCSVKDIRAAFYGKIVTIAGFTVRNIGR